MSKKKIVIKIINKVSNTFGMKTMKDYHKLYFECRVLLLPDVLEIFRNNILKTYGLLPSHSLSANS